VIPRIRYKLQSASGEPIAEPAELVDPRTDCGNQLTELSSKPVRRMNLLITTCMCFGGGSLLSIVLFIPFPDPNAHTAALIIWILWALFTGTAFLASLISLSKKAPTVMISRPCIVNGLPIALRWRLPDAMQKRVIKIQLCGEEEWTHVLRMDTQVEIYRFLILALVDLPEDVTQREGAVFFQPPPLPPSLKENARKIRYWISFQNLPGTLSSFEYDVTVSASPEARPNDR